MSAPDHLLLGRLLPLAVLASAALVFLVQPMVGRLLMPSLGGAPAVWNTSLLFFQAALLAGYAYAHGLQRIASVRRQAGLHLAVLLAAALALPIRATERFGAPDVEHPAPWLLLVLLASVGAPFAALSATAPLMQAWWAAAWGGRRDPYPLYAASNAGSLLALLAYPLLVEPALGLRTQTVAWAAAYAGFAVMVALIAVQLPRSARAVARPASAPAAGRWRQRGWWTLLAAIPSSLLLGVTSHISTDVASAPFLWVVPLALYLLTFVLAFSDRWRPPVGPLLTVQALAAAAAVAAVNFNGEWLVLLPVHLLAFVLTTLVCHGRLARDRPGPERLTEFYLALAAGGVLGGAVNALLAPTLFDQVWEYPLALILAAVARPRGSGRISLAEWVLAAWGAAAFALVLATPAGPPSMAARLALGSLASAAFFLRGRRLAFAVLLAALALGSARVATHNNYIRQERSFFGVHRVAYNSVPGLGAVRFLMHGTTTHGAQSAEPGQACRPLTYYAPGSPIAQALRTAQADGPARVAVVGLGAGSVAVHARPEDRFRFFEIDPVVAEMARSSFSLLEGCAPGRTAVVLGDARLTVGREPPGGYDLLLLDAFSSDAVPTHLLTVEAMRVWLGALKPDGLLVLHISNRNLELEGTAAAALRAAGPEPLVQLRPAPAETPPLADLTSHVLATSRSPAMLARLRDSGPWRPARADVRAWTDDRTDVLGALVREQAR